MQAFFVYADIPRSVRAGGEMKKIACLGVVLGFLIGATAWAEDPVAFPDPNLKAAVVAALGIPNPTPTEMLGLTQLEASSKGIGDLTGLRYALNLTTLMLEGNRIRDLTELETLSRLTVLALTSNQISDISPVRSLTQLTMLTMGFNQIQDISPLAGLTHLTDLSLKFNQVHDTSSLAGLTNLTWLSLVFNQVADISALSNLSQLKALFLWGNQISNLSPLATLTDLTDLTLDYNAISDIGPLSNLAHLASLGLHGNPLDTAAYCVYLPLIYEHNPQLTVTYDPNPNPLTADCSTNLSDLVFFTSTWLAAGCNTPNNWCEGADLNHDGRVDMGDWVILTDYWLE
jgi:hypothetical protein